MPAEDDKRPRGIVKFTSSNIETQRKLRSLLPDERRTHNQFREELYDVLEGLYDKSVQTNLELVELVRLDGVPKVSGKASYRKRAEHIAKLLDQETSSSKVMVCASAPIYPLLIGASQITVVYPEEAQLLLNTDYLNVDRDFTFTAMAQAKDSRGRVIPGMEMRRDSHIFMRHNSLARDQGILNNPEPMSIGYDLSKRGPKRVLDSAYIADATKDTPIPADFLTPFETTDMTEKGENRRMYERWMVADMLEQSAPSIVGLVDAGIDVLGFLHEFRSGFMTRLFLDELIKERGYRL